MKKILLLISPTSSRPFTDGWRYGRGSDLTSMNVETLSAIVEDAHGAGIKVFTHTSPRMGPRSPQALEHQESQARRAALRMAALSPFCRVQSPHWKPAYPLTRQIRGK
jgi:hypothetical protein